MKSKIAMLTILDQLKNCLEETSFYPPKSWKFWNQENQVKIQCQNGAIFNCDYCICTFPPGVIQKFHNSLFDPKLPSKKLEAYNSICPGSVSKYFIEWNEKWREKK